MDVALFNAILEKIKLESDTGKPVLICLYNWGEPLLHPRLVELVHAVHAAGFHVFKELGEFRASEGLFSGNAFQNITTGLDPPFAAGGRFVLNVRLKPLELVCERPFRVSREARKGERERTPKP